MDIFSNWQITGHRAVGRLQASTDESSLISEWFVRGSRLLFIRFLGTFMKNHTTPIAELVRRWIFETAPWAFLQPKTFFPVLFLGDGDVV